MPPGFVLKHASRFPLCRLNPVVKRTMWRLAMASFFLWLLAGCGGGFDDELVGTWLYEGEVGREVTVFEEDGSVMHVRATGDTLVGFYNFVNRNTVKLDVVDQGDSLAFLWSLRFMGDSLYVTQAQGAVVGLRRIE